MAATAPLDAQWDFSCDFEVDFGSDENASIIYAALVVDKELQPDKVKRLMSVSDGKLSVWFMIAVSIQQYPLAIRCLLAIKLHYDSFFKHFHYLVVYLFQVKGVFPGVASGVCNGLMHFEAVESRFLRASFSAFVDVLTLSAKTIEEFGKAMAL